MSRSGVSVRLVAGTLEDLAAAVEHMRHGGVVFGSISRSPGRKGDYLAYGSIDLTAAPKTDPLPASRRQGARP